MSKIVKVEDIKEKEKLINFFREIWSDDLENTQDINYFLESDIFYIKEKEKIACVMEIIFVKNNKSYFSEKYDFECISSINEENFVFISRVATKTDYRNKWYAKELINYIEKYYPKNINIYTWVEDLNFSFYEKLWFKNIWPEIKFKNYSCFNYIKIIPPTSL